MRSERSLRRILNRWSISYQLSKLDGIIRIAVDKVLPKSLTIRYISALVVVATLAISGQVIVQTSLSSQSEDHRRIQLLERQVHDSENLRKATLSLALSSRESQIKIQIELIEALAQQFQKTNETLKAHGISSINGSYFPESVNTSIKKIENSLASIIENCRILGITAIPIPDQQLGKLTHELLNSESIYRTSLGEITKYVEVQLEEQMANFKRIEFLLLLATLLVLAIEALYVFRPAVESLYEALRIRSDFLGRMGHEMRNPMNSIQGMNHLLSETKLTEQQQKYLNILKRSSTGLLDVLNNLLDFSSLESGSIKSETIPFDLYKVVEKSIDLAVYGAHANGIELILDLGMNVPHRLKGDPVKLQQILTNLLGNAVKFTKQGDVTLSVQLESRESENEEVWIHFAVTDTGIGIRQEKLQAIFDPFVQEDSTVRRRFGGTGLGLSISKDLVSFLGGTLAVDSKKDSGSRFYFSLPFSINEEVSLASLIQVANTQEDRLPYRAWLAEPNENIARTVGTLISESKGNAFFLKTNKELSNLLLQLSGDPVQNDLVLIDYEFFRETLPTLFSQVRKGHLDPESFVFFVKTTTSSKDIERLATYGFRNFIFKPIKPLQILEVLEQCLFGNAKLNTVQTLEGTLTSSTPLLVQDSRVITDNRTLRILAVDDSTDNQFVVKAYLASLPYQITFADQGYSAIEKVKESQFDIILMDLQMPEMDGYTATQLIREWERSESLTPTPIIAVSAHDHEWGSDRFQKAEFSSYLVKPISPHQLRQTILDFTSHLHTEDLLNTGPDPILHELEMQMAELAPQYLKQRRTEIEEIKQLVEKKDFLSIQTLGHRLKGNAKSYGFEELGNLGSKLEEAAQEQNTQGIYTFVQNAEAYLNEIHRVS